MVNKLKNKLKLPVITGLILGGLDLVLWIFFLIYWFLNRQELFLAEGLFGMMVLHFPASFLLPLLGSTLVFTFNLFSPGAVDYLVPQTIFLFIVGIAQYYFLGYLVGWLIVKLRRRLGFDKSISEPSKKPKLGRAKVWVYNILYLFSTILILQMIMDIISGVMFDFEMYKMNYPPTRHYLELAIFIMWLYITYRITRYNKRQETVKKADQKLLIISISVVVLFTAIYVPKLFISNISEATNLDGIYINKQVKIFFDNPLERLIIMKAAIVGMDEKTYQVAVYSFFGLKYRLIEIERVSEFEIRLLLNPYIQKRQHEAQAGVAEILKKIEHSWWTQVTYSELIKSNRFSPEKIQGIIPGINNTNSLFLRTDYSEHEVYLLMYMEDSYINALKKDFVFEDAGSKTNYIYNSKEMKISKAHQVAVLDSYRIEYAGRSYYIIFDVLSDQEMPADIDHVWRPDNNVKESDIEEILKSIIGEIPSRTLNLSTNIDIEGENPEGRPFLQALNQDARQDKFIYTKFFGIISEDGPFYKVSIGFQEKDSDRFSGSIAIFKKEGDKYRVLHVGSGEVPPCKIIDEENIPISVLTEFGIGNCLTEKGARRLVD